MAFIAARLAVTVVLLLTWAYGVTTYSPFAFDMFVSPRLFPWFTDFAEWHHGWYGAAFLLSAMTLAPDLSRGHHDTLRDRARWWASVGYLAVGGLACAYLIATPLLASLSSGSRSLLVVPGALLPLLWLALIDHLGSPLQLPDAPAAAVTSQRRLLVTCVGAGGFLWLAHLLRAMVDPDAAAGALPWVMAGAWALTLDLAILLAVYVVLSLVTAVAATQKRAFEWEYGLGVALSALAVAEFFRRIVLPPLAFSGGDAASISAPLGAAVALTWSGLRLRTARLRRPRRETGFDLLGGLSLGSVTRTVGLLCAVPVGSAIAISAVAHIDWAFILHDLITIVEAILVFAVCLSLSSGLPAGSWSMRALIAAPLTILVAVHAMPHAAAGLMTATHDARLDPEALLDRFRTTDTLARVAAAAVVEHRGSNAGFYRELLETEARRATLQPMLPEASFSAGAAPIETPPPHVFMFVIDSLRRDYLSPYNPSVTFTPAIDRWARDSFVFRNAFTPYGGTWLAMPSIWTGSAVPRSWARVFARINAIESLIVAANYDFVINDFTIEQALRPGTRRTFLDRGIPSVNTDLCQNLASLQLHLDARPAGSPPVFSYLAPMNIHILNTRTEVDAQGANYPGFFAPYASRLKRIDSCFGAFLAYLEDRGIYDDSVILLTSDHGDSLGSEGRWGHQFFLFPEDIRIPLIVHLPAGRQPTVTADLGRIAFLTDIAPTLFALTGQAAPDLGPGYGSTLFVDSGLEPRARRRDSFLVMSSYGSAYGVLRRNGTFLYIADLIEWREYAYTLLRHPLGERTAISDALRSVNQTLIREHVDRAGALYGIR